jgi:predicted transcriptional regulator
MSRVGEKQTKDEIAKECGVHRESIHRWMRNNPEKATEVDRIIYENIKAQKHLLGSLGMNALVKKLKANKVSSSDIKLALTVSGDYVEKMDSTNRYESMKEDDLDNTIMNFIQRQKHKRTMEDLSHAAEKRDVEKSNQPEHPTTNE